MVWYNWLGNIYLHFIAHVLVSLRNVSVLLHRFRLLVLWKHQRLRGAFFILVYYKWEIVSAIHSLDIFFPTLLSVLAWQIRVSFKSRVGAGCNWLMLLMLILQKLKQEALHEFETNMGYTVSARVSSFVYNLSAWWLFNDGILDFS